MQSKLTFLWKEPDAARKYRAAASLHSHTNHSREGLCFIPKHAARHPLLALALAKLEKRKAVVRSGIAVDFGKAYWTPPLSPLAAFQLERNQIQHVLGLAGMVSLTDHDNIDASMSLRLVPEACHAPISVEWSVPCRETTLHLGLHNLPITRAEAIMGQLAEYTKNPSANHLSDLLHMLHQNPDVLIVLNHPMWDLTGIGRERHIRILGNFVAKHGMFIHAFELGGWRSWEENRAVLHFAERWKQLVVAGGDRHCVEPNAVLNLTDAESFSEFVHEVRQKRRCHVVFMPQYAEPIKLRGFQSLLAVVREYPHFPAGSRRWDQRVFHPDRDGVTQPLVALWRKPPSFIEIFFSTVRMLEFAPIRRAVQFAIAKPKQEMHLALSKAQEATS